MVESALNRARLMSVWLIDGIRFGRHWKETNSLYASLRNTIRLVGPRFHLLRRSARSSPREFRSHLQKHATPTHSRRRGVRGMPCLSRRFLCHRNPCDTAYSEATEAVQGSRRKSSAWLPCSGTEDVGCYRDAIRVLEKTWRWMAEEVEGGDVQGCRHAESLVELSASNHRGCLCHLGRQGGSRQYSLPRRRSLSPDQSPSESSRWCCHRAPHGGRTGEANGEQPRLWTVWAWGDACSGRSSSPAMHRPQICG
jgi:hypothetical protein